MELIPDNHLKNLDLIIIFSDRCCLYTNICNRRP